jgi:hypothetical protein
MEGDVIMPPVHPGLEIEKGRLGQVLDNIQPRTAAS